MATVGSVGATGDDNIDGLLSGWKWVGTLTYSFPDSANDFEAFYGSGEPDAAGFAQISTAQQQAVHTAFTLIQSYTNLTITYAGTNDADIRIAQSSSANPTAYAYYPGDYEGGDVWFGTSENYRSPKLGDYSNFTHLHELGHALGLKHTHEVEGPGNTAVTYAHDTLEYSVMSYRSYVGADQGYTNETYGYPTTFMRDDIRALQEMYGADFTAQSGDTVYAWSPTTGEFFIDGVGQGRPGGPSAGSSANVVFMTVWDGGGNDTYDLSAYTSGVSINLNPGAGSTLAATQIASLDWGVSASASVYNAYLFEGDARSYIENAIGGSGSDTLVGNATANRLEGGAGSDTLTGGGGDDVFVFASGYGADTINDFVVSGGDVIDLTELLGYYSFAEVASAGQQSGANTVFAFGTGLTLTLLNVSLASLTSTEFMLADGGAEPGDDNVAPSNLSLSAISVKEGAAGATIGNLIVQDLNGDSIFTFDLSDNRFAVSGSPGAYQLKLNSGIALDYETERTVSLSITATDAGGLSKTQAFTINVGNVVGVRAVGTTLADTFNADQTVLSRRSLTSEADTVDGRAGNDTIAAGGGNDILTGGAGNDTILGQDGDDKIAGGSGADQIDGGAGSDTASYAASAVGVTIDLNLDGVAQTSLGDGAGDTLTGIENLLGSVRADWLIGDEFDNVIEGGAGNDVLDGGDGADTVSYAGSGAGVTVNLSLSGAQNTIRAGVDTLSGIENIIGSRGADALTGDDGANVLTGGLGYDTLSGGLGADTFHFNSLAEKGDRIVDFVSGVDTLSISAAGFSGAVAGSVNFASGSTPLAGAGKGWFLHDTDDGKLYYDADGAASGARQLLATFATGTLLTSDDILVV